MCHRKKLGGGFNPVEKYESNWESSPNRGEMVKNNFLKPPGKYPTPELPGVKTYEPTWAKLPHNRSDESDLTLTLQAILIGDQVIS